MEDKICEMIKAMAEEISTLRRECDYEEGRYDKNAYDIDKIINDYKEEYL